MLPKRAVLVIGVEFYWIRGLLVGEGHGEGGGLGEWCDDEVGRNWILFKEEKKFGVR